jgi:hypothetical protein
VASIPASHDATTDPAPREGADATRTATVAEEASALSSGSPGGDAVASGQPAAGGSPPSTGSKQVPPMATDGDPADAARTNPGRPADPNADLHPRAILTAQRFARLPLLPAAGPRTASLVLMRAARSPILRTGADLDLLDPNLDPGENFVTALQAISRSFDASKLNSGSVESWAAAAETLAGQGSIDKARSFTTIARTLAEHLEREAGSTRQLAEFATAYANTLSRRDHPSAPKPWWTPPGPGPKPVSSASSPGALRAPPSAPPTPWTPPPSGSAAGTMSRTWDFGQISDVERMTGIEPAPRAWKAVFVVSARPA